MKQRNFSIIIITIISSIILINLGGCSQKPKEGADQKNQASPEYVVNKEYDRGQVKFYLRVDKTEITIAEKIKLVLEVEAHKSFIVNFPELLGQLGQFSIKNSEVLPSKALDKDIIRTVHTYELVPFLSGDYKIPPLTFKYWTEQDTEDNAHTLETEEIAIKVISILPDTLEKLEIKDIKGPIEPPAPNITLYIILGCSILIVITGGVLFIIWWIKRRQKMIEALYIPAHELAFRQLRALVDMNYIDTAQFKLFYGGISNILRHYIENRFGLQAPERTTEEFLVDIRESDVLNTEQKKILAEFLKHCDMVKFAELIPTTEQIQQTFDLCKSFIMETKNQEVKIEDTGDHNPYINAPELTMQGDQVSSEPPIADETSDTEIQEVPNDKV